MCLTKDCSGNDITMQQAINRVRLCHAEFDGMTYKERVHHMLTKLKSMVKGVAESGYTNISYFIGERGELHYKENICRTCFRNAYNIGNTALTDILSKIKDGANAYTVPFGPATPPLDPAIAKGIISMGARKGIKLSHSQIGNNK